MAQAVADPAIEWFFTDWLSVKVLVNPSGSTPRASTYHKWNDANPPAG